MMYQNDTNNLIRNFISPNLESDFEYIPYFWNINYAAFSGDDFHVTGWALPYGGRKNGSTILVNGCEADYIEFADSKEVASLYPWWPNAHWSNFFLRINKNKLSLPQGQDIEFTAMFSSNKKAEIPPYRSFFLNLSDFEEAFPDASIYQRIGQDNVFHYALFGKTLYRHFDYALKKFFGLRFKECNHIVDWGCGAGRVSRHIISNLRKEQKFVGYDIDASAVDWANQNLGKKYMRCGTIPQLPCEPEWAEVVFAYSVFSHLSRDVLKKWIAEIARIIRPGGYFLFTVLSSTAMLALLPDADESFLKSWKKEGIFDSIENEQLKDIGFTGEYYRNVWITKDFIHKYWGQYFEILQIETNFHFYQDLVVCRRIAINT